MTDITTDRLRIRNFRVEDWKALHGIIQQYKASGLAVYDHEWPAAQEEYPKIAEWFATGDSYRAVGLMDSDRLIGFVCLNPDEKQGTRQYSLGYTFGSDYHGEGYATEACSAALSHAFSRLEADAIVTGTAQENEASQIAIFHGPVFPSVDHPASYRRRPRISCLPEMIGLRVYFAKNQAIPCSAA